MLFELNGVSRQLKRMQETQFQDSERLNRTLNGQRIVLIGGTSGFGFATAKGCRPRRRIDHRRLQQQSQGRKGRRSIAARHQGYPLDITREASVEEFFSTIGRNPQANPGLASNIVH